MLTGLNLSVSGQKSAELKGIPAILATILGKLPIPYFMKSFQLTQNLSYVNEIKILRAPVKFLYYAPDRNQQPYLKSENPVSSHWKSGFLME